jgi:pyrimidine-nucleoside phosphorylase
MPPQNPKKIPVSVEEENAGFISIGSLEEKLPTVLVPLLSSSDIILGNCKNYTYPRELSVELIDEIKLLLQKKNIKSVVFDLRIHGWTDTPNLKRSRILARSLQDLCDDLQINNSIFLSNGDHFFGNAVGRYSEKMEAREVLRGEGPPDLTKFALEIGADYMLMTQKARLRTVAKKQLRDKIISGEIAPSRPGFAEKTAMPSKKNGYIHHIALDKLNALRTYLSIIHPELGLQLAKKPGDWVAKGETVADVCIPEGQKNPIKQKTCQELFVMFNTPPNHHPLILERLGLNIHS